MNILEIIVCVALFGSFSPKVEGWKGIVPLRSTRADVERLLGPPSDPCKSLCKYEMKNEVVFARYSGEPCNNEEQNRWRIPPDTVIDLTVNLEETPKLSGLKLNLKKFKKTKDPELHGYSTYEDEENGVSYAVSADGRVYSIHWFANTKDDKALSCQSCSGRHNRFQFRGGGVSQKVEGWKGIVPLRSTRADVERLLGRPSTDRSDTAFYQYDTEEVSIDYSKGLLGRSQPLERAARHGDQHLGQMRRTESSTTLTKPLERLA